MEGQRRSVRLPPLPESYRLSPTTGLPTLGSPSFSGSPVASLGSPGGSGGSTGVSPSVLAAKEERGAAAKTAPPSYFVEGIQQTEGWDEEDEEERAVAAEGQDALGKSMTGSFTCRRGPEGVLSIALERGFGSIRSLDDTLSSPSAIRGSKLKWVRGEAVGRGSLGTVFQAMDQETGQVFAVKEVFINPGDESDLKFKAELENEIRICKALSHPRIVSYLGHDYMDSCLYIYLEYMAGGSMSQVLEQFGAFDETLMAVYTRELLEGLEYLHTRSPPVVHRDVKGGNVLVGLDCRVKLADFGCSKRSIETMSHTMRGSIPWMAPEVICNTGYGRTADIWSFGCVVIEMATAASPWGKFDNPMAAMFKIAKSDATPPVPESLSSACRDFIGLCLQRDATKRPPATELLQHDFVRDVTSDF